MPKSREQREAERAARRERIRHCPPAAKPTPGPPPKIDPEDMPSREEVLKAWRGE